MKIGEHESPEDGSNNKIKGEKNTLIIGGDEK